MADTEKMYGRLSETRLDEITEKIEMKYEESLLGIITILKELSPEEITEFLNIVGQSKGKSIKIPQDIDDIIEFSVKYLVSRGVDVSKRSRFQNLNSNYTDDDAGMFAMAEAILEERRRSGR